MTRTARIARLAAGWLLALATGMAAAAFPEKAVTLVVPYPAGGAADLMARSLAQNLGTALGQQVVVDNRGGAGGGLAAEMVANAPADGYTLLFGTMGTQAINPSLYRKLPYDPVKDFAPIALTHITPRVLVVGTHVRAKSVAELIALAKRKPGELTYGSAGNGSSSHLSGALFESLAGVKLLHVPYKGSAPLLNDMLAGRIDITFDSYAVYEPHIKAGKVRPLGVTSKERMQTLPALPTIAESGLAGFEVANWLGVLAPAGTPKATIDALNQALGKAMADPAMRRQLASLGIEPTISTPDEFAALIHSEIPKWAAIVKASGASID